MRHGEFKWLDQCWLALAADLGSELQCDVETAAIPRHLSVLLEQKKLKQQCESFADGVFWWPGSAMAAGEPNRRGETLKGSIKGSRQMGWLLCLPGLCNGVFWGVRVSAELVFPKGRPCWCHAVHPALAPGCHQKLVYGTRWYKWCPQVVVAGVGGGEWRLLLWVCAGMLAMGKLGGTVTGSGEWMGFITASSQRRVWVTIFQTAWRVQSALWTGKSFPLQLLVWVADTAHPAVCPSEGCDCPSPADGRAYLSSPWSPAWEVFQPEQMQPQSGLETPQADFLSVGLRKTSETRPLAVLCKQESWQAATWPWDGNLFNQHVCLQRAPVSFPSVSPITTAIDFLAAGNSFELKFLTSQRRAQHWASAVDWPNCPWGCHMNSNHSGLAIKATLLPRGEVGGAQLWTKLRRLIKRPQY